jgi:hypothetical protein
LESPGSAYIHLKSQAWLIGELFDRSRRVLHNKIDLNFGWLGSCSGNKRESGRVIRRTATLRYSIPETPSNKYLRVYLIMPTISVGPESGLELQEIADAMARSKKVVVVTGAGISTNCGIPVSHHKPACLCAHSFTKVTGLSLRRWSLLAHTNSIRRRSPEPTMGEQG